MNKTILKAIERIRWNTEHHFLHIKNQHEIAPQIGVQFSMGYTDARFIQFFWKTKKIKLICGMNSRRRSKRFQNMNWRS
ncbi:hypothetical protein [Weissella cibaria]|uniref:hypothetical protein n=1 Tax=Weissella cibaria TaxID=137591 RepID=UPI0022E2472A|nr:hypothetical protein [Weissella cibaria]